MRRVVITGMGVVSPIGNDIETFKKNLFKGFSGIGSITHFDTADYKVKIAAEVKNFYPLSFLDRSEIRRTDLFTQYAVLAAMQAVKESGITDSVKPQDLGVYFSSGVGGMLTFEQETKKLNTDGPGRISPYFIAMMIENIAAGTLAIKFNAQGPSLSIVTACASSTNTIGEAFRAIKHGYARSIIAGGSEAAITPLSIAGFTNCMALSKRNDISNASIPFDKRRDGFIMGEGAGCVILEEYEHAKNRGAKILGEITGYGNTCDAHHVTAPRDDAECASAAIVQAMKEAGISSAEGVYINAHGTSTPLNDKSETLAIKKAFGDGAKNLLISSSKSMTGHCLGAAGAIEAIASILALNEGMAPPTINYLEPDPDCDLNYVPNSAVKADLKYALSNSFGFGGHNASIAFKKV